MNMILGLMLIFTSISSFAGTTCTKGSRTVLSCQSEAGVQVDVCKKSNSFQVRLNGEIYALAVETLITDDVFSFQGINYSGVRFILEQRNSSSAVLTEVNRFEMPIGEEIELACI